MKSLFCISALILSTTAFAADAAKELMYRKDGGSIILVLSPGQEVMSSLSALMTKEKIPAATFTGVGSVRNVEVAIYDLQAKVYKTKKFDAPGEVTSLVGNLSSFDKKPVVHAHIAVTNPDFTLYGGHLNKADVAVSLEIAIVPLSHPIERELVQEFPSAKVMNLNAKP